MRHVAAASLVLAMTVPALPAAADVVEPRTGVSFPERSGDLSLLGVGLRTKTILKVKVYAVALYAADSALAMLKDKVGTPDFHRELVWGDFPKEIRLRLVRDVSASQMQDSIREALKGADKGKVDTFVSYFGDIMTGEEYVLRWTPGGVLETIAKGTPRPPIADKNFAGAVFGIWLGENAIQDDIKHDLVSRAPQVVR